LWNKLRDIHFRSSPAGVFFNRYANFKPGQSKFLIFSRSFLVRLPVLIIFCVVMDFLHHQWAVLSKIYFMYTGAFLYAPLTVSSLSRLISLISSRWGGGGEQCSHAT
jgi:hypothetical protein